MHIYMYSFTHIMCKYNYICTGLELKRVLVTQKNFDFFILDVTLFCNFFKIIIIFPRLYLGLLFYQIPLQATVIRQLFNDGSSSTEQKRQTICSKTLRYYLLLTDLSLIVYALQINHRDKGGRKALLLHPYKMTFFLKWNSIIDQSKG